MKKETLFSYIQKYHNTSIALRFEEIRKSKGDEAAIEYVLPMFGPGRFRYEEKLKKLAALEAFCKASTTKN